MPEQIYIRGICRRYSSFKVNSLVYVYGNLLVVICLICNVVAGYDINRIGISCGIVHGLDGFKAVSTLVEGVVTDLNIEVKVLVIEIGYIEGYRSHGIARAVYGSHVGLQHFKRHRVVVHIAQRNCLRIMVIVYVYIEIYGVLRLIVFIFVRFVAHSVIDNFGCLGIDVEVEIERAVIGILRRIVRPALHAGEHSLHMNEVLPVA